MGAQRFRIPDFGFRTVRLEACSATFAFLTLRLFRLPHQKPQGQKRTCATNTQMAWGTGARTLPGDHPALHGDLPIGVGARQLKSDK
jgi:hypothetical protein